VSIIKKILKYFTIWTLIVLILSILPALFVLGLASVGMGGTPTIGLVLFAILMFFLSPQVLTIWGIGTLGIALVLYVAHKHSTKEKP
jgi:hypothetical protein